MSILDYGEGLNPDITLDPAHRILLARLHRGRMRCFDPEGRRHKGAVRRILDGGYCEWNDHGDIALTAQGRVAARFYADAEANLEVHPRDIPGLVFRKSMFRVMDDVAHAATAYETLMAAIGADSLPQALARVQSWKTEE